MLKVCLKSLSTSVVLTINHEVNPVTHGQCDARPAVTFLASEHHRPSTSTRLYCLVTGRCAWAACNAVGRSRTRYLIGEWHKIYNLAKKSFSFC